MSADWDRAMVIIQRLADLANAGRYELGQLPEPHRAGALLLLAERLVDIGHSALRMTQRESATYPTGQE